MPKTREKYPGLKEFEKSQKAEKERTKKDHLSFVWEKWIIQLARGLNPEEKEQFKQDLKDFGLSQTEFSKYREKLKEETWEEQKILKEKHIELNDLWLAWHEKLDQGLSPQQEKEFNQTLKNAEVTREIFDIYKEEYDYGMELASRELDEGEKIEKDKKIAEARGEIDEAFEEDKEWE
jgi:hypothetical protein